MFGLYIYRQYEIERPKTTAEVRAEAIRRSESAAATSERLRALTAQPRLLFRAVFARRPGSATAPPAVVRCPDTITAEMVAAELAPVGSSAGRPSSGDAS